MKWEKNSSIMKYVLQSIADFLISHSHLNIFFLSLVNADKRENYRKFLKLDWSDFHLSSLGGVVISFPVIPVDAISEWRVFSVMIHTVQIGVMTVTVPPGSFIGHSTATAAPAVIIFIFGAEGITTMIRKRITSSKSLKREWLHL